MIVEYIGKVLAFAFRRTTPTIDSLQIVAASAVPAIAKMAGFKMAASVTNDVLAYIGAMAIVFIFLRLVSAPYFIWREQLADTAALKFELTKPERMELARLAEIRAEAKAELASICSQMVFMALRYKPERDKGKIASMVNRGIALCARANAPRSFDNAFTGLSHACFDLLDAPAKPATDSYIPVELLNDMQAYLHGEITAEALALRLPPKPEEETPP